MELYANSSSFEANLTLQTRNSLRDVSFSSYLNQAEENMVRKLTNDHHYHMKSKSEEDDEEIGVFGAEKYFKGEIEEGGNNNDHRFIDSTSDTARKMHQQDDKSEEFDQSFPAKLRGDETSMHTPSVRSNASCNSRSGLLPRAKQSPGKIENESKTKTKTKTLLARFGCNCLNKKSTQINEKRFLHAKEMSKPHLKISDFDQKNGQFSSKLAETKTRKNHFTFPVLNSNDLNSNSNSSSNSKSGNLAGKIRGDNNNNNNNNGGRLSIGKKLSLLNDWDMDIPTGDGMYISSSRTYNKDVDSDSSSDLFEIESFSPTGDSSYLGHRKSESNCYAPSEVSVDWSVVTASAADFSVVSDQEDGRTGGGGWRNSGGKARVTDKKDEQKKRPGILSGCANHKAVRVAGDEYKVSGGGAGGRRRLSDSVAVGGMFRGGII
ncbi:hypothetical protein L1987_11186 [Smallanthus sonchifolius]|uniref:Uncharacterized protein n=1 Tax=Smallanthus sonchifolius TaxID=185202 RepID=A0ACB9JCH3_9ASTR|nr:hypothetical protein L1987_11186 [Smallanthus sonchifolius]